MPEPQDSYRSFNDWVDKNSGATTGASPQGVTGRASASPGGYKSFNDWAASDPFKSAHGYIGDHPPGYYDPGGFLTTPANLSTLESTLASYDFNVHGRRTDGAVDDPIRSALKKELQSYTDLQGQPVEFSHLPPEVVQNAYRTALGKSESTIRNRQIQPGTWNTTTIDQADELAGSTGTKQLMGIIDLAVLGKPGFGSIDYKGRQEIKGLIEDGEWQKARSAALQLLTSKYGLEAGVKRAQESGLTDLPMSPTEQQRLRSMQGVVEDPFSPERVYGFDVKGFDDHGFKVQSVPIGEGLSRLINQATPFSADPSQTSLEVATQNIHSVPQVLRKSWAMAIDAGTFAAHQAGLPVEHLPIASPENLQQMEGLAGSNRVTKAADQGARLLQYMVPVLGQATIGADAIDVGIDAGKEGLPKAAENFVSGLIKGANPFEPGIYPEERVIRAITGALLIYGAKHGIEGLKDRYQSMKLGQELGIPASQAGPIIDLLRQSIKASPDLRWLEEGSSPPKDFRKVLNDPGQGLIERQQAIRQAVANAPADTLADVKTGLDHITDPIESRTRPEMPEWLKPQSVEQTPMDLQPHTEPPAQTINESGRAAEAKTRLQRLGIKVEAEQPGIQRVYSGDDFQQALQTKFNYPADQALATRKIADAMAETWAGKTGGSVEQWYKDRIYGVGGKDGGKSGGQTLHQIPVEVARQIDIPVSLPTDERFVQAVKNTGGAEITAEGLIMNPVRYQHPDQAYEQSLRTGVFYLPDPRDPNTRFYRRSMAWHGGSERIEGETMVKRPLVVKGATGGKVPANAYDQLQQSLFEQAADQVGPSSYKELREQYFKTVGLRPTVEQIRDFLQRNGGDPSVAHEIVRQGQNNNRAIHASLENVIINRARNSGYDSILGISNRKTGPYLSELIDLRESHYPSPYGEYEIHPHFERRYNEEHESGATFAPHTGGDGGRPEPASLRSAGLLESLEGQTGDVSPRVSAPNKGSVLAKGELAFGRAEPGDFRDRLIEAKQANPHGASVTVYEPREYEGFKTFLSANGKAGYAVTPDGDIISVFKHPDAPYRGLAQAAVWDAVRHGGNRLDAFDTILPHLYSESGFKVVARLPFDPDYAPEGWDYGKFGDWNGGKPDVVFMIHDPSAPKYQPGDGVTVDSYDQGIAAQKQALRELRRPKPAPEGQPQLFQRGKSAKASIEFLDSGQAVIRALKNPDFSSALHELGHLARRELYRDGIFDASDRGIVEDWAGVKDGRWNTAAEEKFARGWERYFATGKAPTDALIPIFEQIKGWLIGVYQKIVGSAIDIDVSPAVTKIFDRMLGGERSAEAIREQQGLLGVDSSDPRIDPSSPAYNQDFVDQIKDVLGGGREVENRSAGQVIDDAQAIKDDQLFQGRGRSGESMDRQQFQAALEDMAVYSAEEFKGMPEDVQRKKIEEAFKLNGNQSAAVMKVVAEIRAIPRINEIWDSSTKAQVSDMLTNEFPGIPKVRHQQAMTRARTAIGASVGRMYDYQPLKPEYGWNLAADLLDASEIQKQGYGDGIKHIEDAIGQKLPEVRDYVEAWGHQVSDLGDSTFDQAANDPSRASAAQQYWKTGGTAIDELRLIPSIHPLTDRQFSPLVREEMGKLGTLILQTLNGDKAVTAEFLKHLGLSADQVRSTMKVVDENLSANKINEIWDSTGQQFGRTSEQMAKELPGIARTRHNYAITAARKMADEPLLTRPVFEYRKGRMDRRFDTGRRVAVVGGRQVTVPQDMLTDLYHQVEHVFSDRDVPKGAPINPRRLLPNMWDESRYIEHVSHRNEWLQQWTVGHREQAVTALTKELVSYKQRIKEQLGPLIGDPKARQLIMLFAEKKLRPQGITDAEWQANKDAYNLQQLKAARPQDWQAIEKSAQWFKGQYDHLFERLKNLSDTFGTPEPLYRQDYFTHISEEASAWDHLFAGDMSGGSVGDYRKNAPSNRFLKRRLTDRTQYDAVVNFEEYLKVSLSQLHLTEPAIRRRVLAKALRDQTMEGDIQTLANYLDSMADVLTVRKTGDQPTTLRTQTDNALMAALDWVTTRTAGNKIVGNIRSALMQTSAVPLAVPFTGVSHIARGSMMNLMALTGRTADLIERSDFMTRRYPHAIGETPSLISPMVQLKGGEIGRGLLKGGEQLAVIPMEVIERSSARVVWYANYLKALEPMAGRIKDLKGRADGSAEMTAIEDRAIRQADKMTERILSGRSIGEKPPAFYTWWGRIGFQFQLEVNNFLQLYGHDLMYDENRGRNVGTVQGMQRQAALLVSLYLANNIYQTMFNDRPLPDPIQMAVDMTQMDDKDDPWRTFARRFGRMAGEALSIVPGGSQVAGLLPETNVLGTGMSRKDILGRTSAGAFANEGTAITSTIRQSMSGNDFGEWLFNIFTELGMPYGGSQLRKTIRGMEVADTGEMKSKTKDGSEGRVKFQTTDPLDPARALIFGPYGTDAGKQYIDDQGKPKEGRKPAYGGTKSPLGSAYKSPY
ncbi:MAG: hypothetical protein JSS66_00200 [Armatimonadetes bacterium]|nr:hypothetical protein [Armatimonadota bacterium]